MNAWYRSKGYRAYVIIGLAVCVAVPIALSFGPYKDEPGNKTPGYAAIAVVGVWVLGLMLWQLRRVESDPIEFVEPEPRQLAAADPPLGWKALSAELAVAPDDAAGRQLSGRRMQSGMARQLLLGIGLVVCAIGGNIAFQSGAPAWVFAPALLFVLPLVATVPGMMAAGQSGADAYVRPLGLKMVGMPHSTVTTSLATGAAQHRVIGPTSFAGERHGRLVRIDIESRNYETRVNGRFDKLDVSSENGKLVASDESPAPVKRLIDSLSADERWDNVSVRSRGDGVTVKRKKVGGEQSAMALWLDDLWLGEQVADRSAKS